jgi:hypothetical protein
MQHLHAAQTLRFAHNALHGVLSDKGRIVLNINEPGMFSHDGSPV